MPKAKRIDGKVRQQMRRAVGYALEDLESRRLLSSALTERIPTLRELRDMGPKALMANSVTPQAVGSGPELGGVAAAGLVTTPQTYSGTLNGKIVFTSGGHGWQWNTTLGRYATDRGDNNEIVEDFGNQEQMSAFADYALRGGATVVTMRPVGRQINEVVMDNDSAGVTFSGAWSNSSSTKFYDEDYGAGADAIPYKFSNTVTGTETATVTYLPNIPAAGMYPVYTWVLYGTDRTSQTYRINHTGGSTEVKVDHSKVGSGWVYLGTYHFNAGSSATGEGSVVVTNKAAVTGKVVIADAIRFGNGMGDYIWTGSSASAISGYPREDENSYHWLARSLGQGTTASSVIGTASSSNVSAPSEMAKYMFHGVFGEAVYIGFHSNAGGGRGARGLIDADVSEQTPHQAGTNGLADLLGDQINQDMQNLNGVFEYNWTTGTTSTFTGQFGEINLGPSSSMDATIIEVAFHDDVSDAGIMRDPNGRDQIARSTYQGTVQYFSLYGSPLATNTSLPTAPNTVRVVSNASGQVTLNWAAGASTPASVYGAAATGYKVYASVDGYGFDGGTAVAGVGTTTLTLTGLDPATPYYFRVAATNAGGESKPSEVVAALPSGGTKDVLIVNGFDRYDRTLNFRYTYLTTGLVDRVWPRYNNSFDYVVQMETAINGSKPGTHVATTSNEAVISGAVNLNDYESVIWISGAESTDDDTFDATEQTKIEAFVAAGGNLFVSGSEIGWDLDQQNNGRTFYETTLKGNYVSDDAGTYTATADAGGIFSGMSSFVFSNGSAFSQLDTQLYNVATPDVIAPQAGAIASLTYSGGTGGTAGIQVQGTGGRGNIVMFGFPFETMTSSARRQTAMGKILDFFAVASAPTAVDLVAASDTGTSTTDNITKKNNSAGNTLQFTVTGTVAGYTVQIFDGATLIGSQLATGTTTTVTTDPNLPSALLAEGSHSITAKQTDGVNTTAASPALSITVDTIAPSAVPAITISSTASANIPDWDAASGADLYRVYRTTTSGSGFASLTTVNSPTTVYTDSSATPGTTYYYVVGAEDTAGNVAANSSEVAGKVPVAPTNVDLEATSDTGSLNTDNITNYDNSVGKPLDFTVNGTLAGATVKLYVNGSFSASVVATGTSTTLQPGSVLVGGIYTITATQQLPGETESAPTASIPLTLDLVAPAAPALPDLSAGNDSGSSNSDNYTSATSLLFSTTAEANGTATLLIDGSPVQTVSSVTTAYNFAATSALADGAHEIRVTVTDRAGNVSTTSSPLSVTVDTQAPVAPSAPDLADASDAGTSNNDDLTNITQPTFTGTAEAGSVVTIYVGGVAKSSGTALGDGTFSVPFVGVFLNPGLNVVTATTKDLAGNVSAVSTSLNVTLDTTPPTASVPDLDAASDSGVSSTDNITNITTPTFTGTAEVGTTVTLLIDGVQTATDSDGDGAYSFTTAALSNINHTFAVIATDAAGNAATTTNLTVTIDTTGPVGPLTPDLSSSSDLGASATDNITSDSTPTFSVIGEAGGTMTLEIDGLVVGTTTSASSTYLFTAPTVSDGPHTVKARITDKAGNVGALSAGTLNITIDTAAPAAPAAPDLDAAGDSGSSNTDNTTSVAQPSFIGAAEAGSTISIYDDGVLRGTGVATGGNYALNLVSAMQEGANAITVQATDLAGNVSAASPSLSVTLDTVAPTASLNPGYTQPANGDATIDFTISYADATSNVDPFTFDGGDVTVSGPNGYTGVATLVGATGNDVTYRIPAPGGTWDVADNGNYTVTQVASEVKDLAGNARPAGTVGTLALAAPFAWISGNVLNIDYAGSSGITISLATNGSNLDVTRQAQTLSFALANFTSIAVAGTTSADTLSSAGTYAQPVTFTGSGGSDTLTVASGSFTFGADAGIATPGLNVNVASGASAIFNTSQHIGALTVAGDATLAAGDDKVIVATSVNVTGRLDLKDNSLIWDYSGASPLGTYSGGYNGAIGLVAAGRASGDWSGNGIVTSQSPAIAPSDRTTIGVAEAADVLAYSGSTATFAGETVDSTAVLFKYTYAGDLNLSGQIDGDDYFIIDFNYPQSGSVFGYHKGDIDLNGKIDADDYFLIDVNYARQGAPL